MKILIASVVVSSLAAFAATAENLKEPDAFAGIEDERARAVAIFEEMGKVFQHQRCVNCHPAGDSPLQGEEMALHEPPVVRGPDGFGAPGMRCTACHGPVNVAYYTGTEGSVPGHEPWHLAPIETAWEGKSVAEICEQVKDPARNTGKTLAELHTHNAEDGLVGWGWEPGEGREPAPGSQKIFGELTKAWIDAGAHCPTG